jgi:hypothetical protein
VIAPGGHRLLLVPTTAILFDRMDASARRMAKRAQVLPGAFLGLEAHEIAQHFVFLATDGTLAKMLLQPRQRSLAGRPGDLEVHVSRDEVEAFRARDLLVLGIGDSLQQASQRGPFHV